MQRSLSNKDITKRHSGKGNGAATVYELDACIIGAGFAGVYLLHQLRQAGFNVKIFEAGTDLGGVWHWANYPGARVDSEGYGYAYSIPEVYRAWNWSEAYPGTDEIKQYFQHVDSVLDIKKDTLFQHRIMRAAFDASTNKWNIECENAVCIRARFFLPCLGYAGKPHIPDWQGMEEYQGTLLHSSFWPADGIDVKGKRVAVVGTGASGIQLASKLADEVAHLTCFVRTPNITTPMRQKSIAPESSEEYLKKLGDDLGRVRYENWGAQAIRLPPSKALSEMTPEEREPALENAWQLGGFGFSFGFTDILTDEKANDIMYEFWTKKQRPRMTDLKKRDLLIPKVAPHAFAGKRPSLEQNYYEQMDKPHVHIVDARNNPVSHLEKTGIVTSDDRLHEFDIIVLATGFDTHTGAYNEIDITGVNGENLLDEWKGGVHSYLGMAVSGFPNMLYAYGPQSPGGFATGPAAAEVQGKWIAGVMKRMRDQGQTRIEAKSDAEQEWKRTVQYIFSFTSWDKVDSWYNGSNIPGKTREALQFAGGIPLYRKMITESLEDSFKGFTVA